ncbi:hypothetical protein KPH14_006902 [Odynerus spinipes]|uniref:Uncharacterized protein n=1 Tax=Odynerus spinipes TaxID=1348599 RepID=A0AAD9RRS5_9HYME|nr:hypothetical protein KPH14_006902 [Odynerus spinipes]
MGNYTSKFLSQDNGQEHGTKVVDSAEQSNFEKACDTVTPLTMRRKLIDPRSITAEIPRTPIEVNNTASKNTNVAISAIPKHLQVKPYLETYFGASLSPLTSNKYCDPRVSDVDQPKTPTLVENLTPCKTPISGLKNNKRVLSSTNLAYYTTLGLDPRSPTVDFDRTPILIPRTTRYQKSISNDNLQENNKTDNCPKFMYCETTSFHTPEILALVDETFEALKSLELNKCDNIESVDKSELCTKDDINCVSIEQSNGDNTSNKKNLPNENTTNAIKIWRDSILLEDLDESESTEYSDQENDEEKYPRLSKEEIEIIFDDDPIKESTPISEKPKTEIDNKNVHDTLENKIKIKTSATVTSGKAFAPYNSNINDTPITKRTPLRNRCNNAQLDAILTKSPQHVLQNKNLSAIIQQENTPPHKRCHAKSKVKGIQWDVNSTVII